MQLGSLLKGRNQQYVSLRDENGTWRILNTLHPTLETIDTDGEIPDDFPAVTVLTEGAFLSLIKEATRLGVVQKIMSTGPAVDNSEYDELKVKYSETQKRVLELEAKLLQESKSEAYLVKSKVVEALLKLAAMSDVSEIKG